MAKPFDPYHSWLGIRPEEQPPNHYRLLGVQPFEDNADAIENAADQRMAHLRTFQTGKRAEHSQALLNEVAAAKLCLLKPERKAKYDKQLRAELEPEVAEPEPVPVVPAIDVSAPSRKSEKKPTTKLPLIVGSAAAGVLVIVGIIVLASTLGRNEEPPPKVAEGPDADVPPAPPPPPPILPKSPPDNESAGTRTSTTEAADPNRPGDWDGPWGNPRLPDAEPPEPRPEPDEPIAQRPPNVEPPVIFEQVEPVNPTPPAGDPPLPAGDPPPAKRPIPAAAVQQPILAKLDDLFNFSGAATPQQNLGVARKLLELADGSRGNPDERFVVLRKAMEMAAVGGDAAMMLDTVDTIAAEYRLDPLTGKANMLSKFAAGATDTPRIEQLVEASLRVIEQALGAGRLDVAMRAADLAYAASQRPAGKQFRKETFDRRQELKIIYDEWKGIRQAQELLAVNPNDAHANLTVGRWLCFHEADWDRGLPHLVKGSDPDLANAAKMELAGPKITPADQLKMADAWWKLAETKKLPDKIPLADRAGYWYEQAKNALPGGLDRARAEMRLKQIARLDQPPSEEPRHAATDRKPDAKPKRNFYSLQAVAKTFGLRPPKWGIAGNEIQGHVTDIKKPENNPQTLKPYRTNSLEFGFKMKAKWFQTIHIYVDDVRYTYARGVILGTLIYDGTKDNPRLGEQVVATDGWSSLAVKLEDDTVSFYYNDVMEWSKKIPPAEGGKHTVVVGFGSSAEFKLQKTIIGIKDVYIERE